VLATLRNFKKDVKHFEVSRVSYVVKFFKTTLENSYLNYDKAQVSKESENLLINWQVT
jgi:hypothetical protein